MKAPRLPAFRFGLFTRILLGLWTAMAITVLVNQLIGEWILQAQQEQAIVQGRLDEIARQAVERYESDGHEALRQWQRQINRSRGIRFLLLDENNQPLGFRKAPSGEQATIPDNPLPAIRVDGGSGKTYRFHLLPSRFSEQLLQNQKPLKGLRLLLTLAIVGLASWLLYRHLQKPILSLIGVSRSLASGQLDARNRPDVLARTDELGTLAGSFNEMADALQNKIHQQEQLLRHISHEIRTPLTRQQLTLARIEQQGATPDLLERLRHHNQQIDHLLGEMLTLFRLEAGPGRQSLEHFEINPLLEQVVEDSQPEWEAKNLTPIIQCDAALYMTGNPSLIMRAIDNLLRNAIRYAPAGSVLRVEAKRGTDNIEFQVSDAGPGVSDEEAELLFTPFYRASGQTQNRQSGGHGLGLAIVAAVAAGHGGQPFVRRSTDGFFSVGFRVRHQPLPEGSGETPGCS